MRRREWQIVQVSALAGIVPLLLSHWLPQMQDEIRHDRFALTKQVNNKLTGTVSMAQTGIPAAADDSGVQKRTRPCSAHWKLSIRVVVGISGAPIALRKHVTIVLG
jgi:hypothetical protein